MTKPRPKSTGSRETIRLGSCIIGAVVIAQQLLLLGALGEHPEDPEFCLSLLMWTSHAPLKLGGQDGEHRGAKFLEVDEINCRVSKSLSKVPKDLGYF